MKKKLLIIRHAKAKEIKPGQADFDRKLSAKGISHAHLMANQLLELGIKADKMYVSPARRTVMTADIFAEVLSYTSDHFIFEKNIYEASFQTLLNIVNQFDEQAETAFIIGHNPGLTYLADYLCGGGIEFIPTTGIAYISFELEKWAWISEGTGNLLWLKTPKMQ